LMFMDFLLDLGERCQDQCISYDVLF